MPSGPKRLSRRESLARTEEFLLSALRPRLTELEASGPVELRDAARDVAEALAMDVVRLRVPVVSRFEHAIREVRRLARSAMKGDPEDEQV